MMIKGLFPIGAWGTTDADSACYLPKSAGSPDIAVEVSFTRRVRVTSPAALSDIYAPQQLESLDKIIESFVRDSMSLYS